MHAFREHGGPVVEAMPAVEFGLYERSVAGECATLWQQADVGRGILPGPAVLVLLFAGERGECCGLHRDTESCRNPGRSFIPPSCQPHLVCVAVWMISRVEQGMLWEGGNRINTRLVFDFCSLLMLSNVKRYATCWGRVVGLSIGSARIKVKTFAYWHRRPRPCHFIW